ncbi:MAG: GNAT family N-acetyltransferase [Firmicutes bacterium]|nr:GNAT family N-acetyltransferase [Bacillota bacterium]
MNGANDSYSGPARTRGYGTEGVKRALEMLSAERKYNEILIWVHQLNVVARKIYEKVGFVVTGTAEWDGSSRNMKMKI